MINKRCLNNIVFKENSMASTSRISETISDVFLWNTYENRAFCQWWHHGKPWVTISCCFSCQKKPSTAIVSENCGKHRL